MTHIIHDPSKSEVGPDGKRKVGYLAIGDGAPALQTEDRKTLLHLLFWLVKTEEGLGFLESHKPVGDLDAVREAMRKVFIDRFGLSNRTLQDALIDGHFAATRWVEANAKLPDPAAFTAREENERIYQQKMSFVMWWLWEDAMNHEFSMAW